MTDAKDQIDRMDKEANWLAEQLVYYCSPEQCKWLSQTCTWPRSQAECVECWRQRARNVIDYEEDDKWPRGIGNSLQQVKQGRLQ